MKRAAVIAAAWVCFVCSVGYADTLTLIGTAGEWHDLKAWDAGRVPTQADDVVIPAGATCTVEPLGLAACRTFDVAGVLVLDRETLVLGSGDGGVDAVCLLDGRIEFKDDYALTPPARIVPDGGWVVFEGMGELFASRAAGEEYQGRLRCCAVTGNQPCDVYAGRGFVIGAGVTVRGSLHLHACLVLNGQWIVDHPEDVSQLGMPFGSLCGGACPVPLTLSGSGRFILRAGQLDVGQLAVSKCNAPKVVIQGGELLTQTDLKARFAGCGK